MSTEALPFVYALRGDRDWKHAPGTAGANRVSPLISQVWQLLERRVVLTASKFMKSLAGNWRNPRCSGRCINFGRGYG